MQLGVATVEEVGGWFPDVVHEAVAEGDVGDVGHVELQAVVAPPLAEVHLHRVGLQRKRPF